MHELTQRAGAIQNAEKNTTVFLVRAFFLLLRSDNKKIIQFRVDGRNVFIWLKGSISFCSLFSHKFQETYHLKVNEPILSYLNYSGICNFQSSRKLFMFQLFSYDLPFANLINCDVLYIYALATRSSTHLL